MEELYKNSEENKQRRQKEEHLQIETAHVWAKGKSKMNKQLQKRLEEMCNKPQYSFSKEPT